MFGATELYNALNVSTVTNLLDAWGTGKALFNEPIIPENCTGTETINFYFIAAINGGLDYGDYQYNVNCRSATYKNSLILANAVFSILNRVSIPDGFMFCNMLQTIPPADNTDTYNTPITVKIKMR